MNFGNLIVFSLSEETIEITVSLKSKYDGVFQLKTRFPSGLEIRVMFDASFIRDELISPLQLVEENIITIENSINNSPLNKCLFNYWSFKKYLF
jgi:hypothetical protein